MTYPFYAITLLMITSVLLKKVKQKLLDASFVSGLRH